MLQQCQTLPYSKKIKRFKEGQISNHFIFICYEERKNWLLIFENVHKLFCLDIKWDISQCSGINRWKKNKCFHLLTTCFISEGSQEREKKWSAIYKSIRPDFSKTFLVICIPSKYLVFFFAVWFYWISIKYFFFIFIYMYLNFYLYFK